MGQPFDKQQAFLYGSFVQAAYEMFLHPVGPDPMRPEPAGIPDGYELGAWIHMSDFILDIVKPKFYGIIAHSISDSHLHIVAIRGTEGKIEWIDDLSAWPVRFHKNRDAGRVAYGFDKIYKSLQIVPRPMPGEGVVVAAPVKYVGSFAEQLEQHIRRREVVRRLELLPGRDRPRRETIVAGHSLGAALATLFVIENEMNHRFDIKNLCTFASPRVGTKKFVQTIDNLPITSWRVVNKNDIVPNLPPRIPLLLNYQHVNGELLIDSSAFAKRNILCRHVLETYLHALDPAFSLRPECVPPA